MQTPRQSSTRRQWLASAGCGFGSLALGAMLKQSALGRGIDSSATAESKIPSACHFAPRAKRIIFVFMQGGPSQVDTFDYKPRLERDHGKKIDFDNARTRKISAERVFQSPWKFQRYGESGKWVSELFPHQAAVVDDLCLIHGMHTEGVAHGPATLFLHTGATNLVRPSMGAWINYGLGSENENLPGFVTIGPPAAKGGPRNYASGFLPPTTQGTAIGAAGQPMKLAKIRHLENRQLDSKTLRDRYDLVRQLSQSQLQNWQGGRDEAEAVIQSYELGFRMQTAAPEILDLSRETEATQRSYGIGQKATDDFGRQCLMARRLAEAGVRYIQINYSDNGANPRWDQHSNLKKHADHALATDQPVAALLRDLKQRGLLEDTVLWWGGEFGRTPFAQGNDGRDHNPRGFTVWLAGGGVRPGLSHGATDDHGYEAVDGRVHMHDLHATLLHLLGVDHTRLTYRHAGRDFRLTDVYGRVVRDLFA